jgi:DnaJ-class molecular chaperone
MGIIAIVLAVYGTLTNHYAVLGIPRDAKARTIRQAYHDIARKHHPDKLPRNSPANMRATSENTFKLANEAYQVLSDPQKRCYYDLVLDSEDAQGKAASNAASARDEAESAGTSDGSATPVIPPDITVPIFCGIHVLAGRRMARVPLFAWSLALGVNVTDEVASRLGLPREIHVPAGSRSGDAVRQRLPRVRPPKGFDVDFVVVALPHWRLQRRGDALHTRVRMPAWHNRIGAPAVCVHGLDGEPVEVRPHGEKLHARGSRGLLGALWTRAGGQRRETVTLPGHGMPLKGASARRGDLVVELTVRSVPEQLLITTPMVAAVAVAVRGAWKVVARLSRYVARVGLAHALNTSMACLNNFSQALKTNSI